MELRWYQTESVAAVWRSIRCGRSPCVVLPTGAGKSLVIAEICREAITKWNGRILVLAHCKELLVQNAEKLIKLLPNLDVGIYSAGLNSRDTDHDVVFCGIQSVYQRAFDFGERHIAIVDEAHLIPDSDGTMYRKFLDDMQVCCPQLKLVGLTATPFRTGAGMITDGNNLLDEICYEVPVHRLIDEGFLCSVTNRRTDCEIDTTRLEVRGKEFTDFSQQVAFDSLAESSVTNFVSIANEAERKSVLVFCSGVSQAERVSKLIEAKSGQECGLVTGDTPAMFRQQTLLRFGKRELRWLVNVSVLTTGYDAPVIDCIVVLRSTMSPGLFAQIVGRGLRTHPDKQSCLVLDYGQNIARHGAIDDPNYGRQSRSSRQSDGGVDRAKACDKCGEDIPINASICAWCGAEQPKKDPHDFFADQTNQILKGKQGFDAPVEYLVDEVHCWEHENRKDATKPTTLRVRYLCRLEDEDGDLRTEEVSEWVCFNHQPGSFAHGKALEWWCLRSSAPMPNSVHAAKNMIDSGAVVHPHRLLVLYEGRWPRITRADFKDEKPEFDIDYYSQRTTEMAVCDNADFDDEDIPF